MEFRVDRFGNVYKISRAPSFTEQKAPRLCHTIQR